MAFGANSAHDASQRLCGRGEDAGLEARQGVHGRGGRLRCPCHSQRLASWLRRPRYPDHPKPTSRTEVARPHDPRNDHDLHGRDRPRRARSRAVGLAVVRQLTQEHHERREHGQAAGFLPARASSWPRLQPCSNNSRRGRHYAGIWVATGRGDGECPETNTAAFA